MQHVYFLIDDAGEIGVVDTTNDPEARWRAHEALCSPDALQNDWLLPRLAAGRTVKMVVLKKEEDHLGALIRKVSCIRQFLADGRMPPEVPQPQELSLEDAARLLGQEAGEQHDALYAHTFQLGVRATAEVLAAQCIAEKNLEYRHHFVNAYQSAARRHENANLLTALTSLLLA